MITAAHLTTATFAPTPPCYLEEISRSAREGRASPDRNSLPHHIFAQIFSGGNFASLDSRPDCRQISSTSSHSSENQMRSKPCLTLDDAHKMVAACRKAGAAKKMEPTVAVVDAGGHLLYLERPDRNGPNTVEMATLKARTAALRERPSSAFAQRVAERPGFLAVPNCLGVPGGVPIIHEDECIGRLGLSGISEHDEPVR